MPATGRESVLGYEKNHGADLNGFLLRTRRSPYWSHSTLDYQWAAARKRAGITRKLNPYSLRHFFGSNCLSKGIPITDVAEWMSHSDINMTHRTYRHLMPASIGRAAKILEDGLVVTAGRCELFEVPDHLPDDGPARAWGIDGAVQFPNTRVSMTGLNSIVASRSFW